MKSFFILFCCLIFTNEVISQILFKKQFGINIDNIEISEDMIDNIVIFYPSSQQKNDSLFCYYEKNYLIFPSNFIYEQFNKNFTKLKIKLNNSNKLKNYLKNKIYFCEIRPRSETLSISTFRKRRDRKRLKIRKEFKDKYLYEIRGEHWGVIVIPNL